MPRPICVKLPNVNNSHEEESKLEPLKDLTSLDLSLDLDSLFGHLEIDTFIEYVRGDLSLNLDNQENEISSISKIKSNYYIKLDSENDTVKINTLPSIKLGVFDTAFGTLDIFIVFKKSKRSALELKKLIFELLTDILSRHNENLTSCFFIKSKTNSATQQNPVQYQTLSGRLLNKSLIVFLRDLQVNLKKDHPIVFVETFGNKTSTITTVDDFNGIKERIYQTFSSRRSLKNIFIDLCISSSLGNNLVTVPKYSFFEKIKTKPNYQLFFTDTVSNLHMKTVKRNGNLNKVGKRFHCVKVNFYSTIKYKLDFDKTPNYILPLSSSLLLTSLFGFRLSSSKMNIQETVDHSIDINSLSSLRRTCPYRTEVRCRYKDSKKTLKKLKKYVILENFQAYNSEDFFSLIRLNLIAFTNVFKNNDDNTTLNLDSKIKLVVGESIMKNMFLRGFNSTLGILPAEIDDIIKTSIPMTKGYIRSLNGIKKLIHEISTVRLTNTLKKAMILRLIKYSPKINDLLKFQLNKLVEVYFDLDNIENNKIIENIINTYVVDTTHDIKLNYTLLQCEPVGNSTEDINIDVFLSNFFKMKNTTDKTNVSKLLYLVFKKKVKINIDDFIIEWMKAKNILSCLSKKKRLEGMFKLSSINYSRNNRSSLRVDLITELNNGLNLNNFQKLKRPLNDDDVVRIIHAMFMYENSETRIWDVYNSFLFNFYFFRTQTWIKNKINWLRRCIKDKKSFFEFMTSVKNWSPCQEFPEHVFNELVDLGIVLSPQKKDICRQIYQLDLNEWNCFKSTNKLQETSYANIFYSVVGNMSPYRAIRNEIYEWCQSEDLSKLVIPSVKSSNNNNVILSAPVSNQVLLNRLNEIEVNLISKMNLLLNEVQSLKDKLCTVIVREPSLPESSKASLDMKESENILFSKFRYRKFNLKEANNTLLIESDLLVKQLDESSIISLLTDKDSSYYRFNLKRKLDSEVKYISFEYLDDVFKKVSKTKPTFTSNHILSRLAGKMRPPSKDLQDYLEDLVSDEYLTEDSVLNKTKYFRISK